MPEIAQIVGYPTNQASEGNVSFS